MPVIRISDESMRRLKTWAEPLEDTAESALTKALDAADAARTAPRPLPPRVPRAPAPNPSERPRREKLPQKAFRQPLLEILYELGGSAHARQLRALVEERMKLFLLPGDLELVSTGEERWWNATCFERSALVKEGYLRADSPRGTWALSNKGLEHVGRSVPEKSSNPFVEHLLAIPNVGEDGDFDRDPSGLRDVDI